MIIKFPKRLKKANKSPVIDFYQKCMKQINGSVKIDNIQVIAFTINPEDYKFLEKCLIIHIKKNMPMLPATRLKFEAGMYMLNLGPRISKNAEKNTVIIDMSKLYDEHAKNKK